MPLIRLGRAAELLVPLGLAASCGGDSASDAIYQVGRNHTVCASSDVGQAFAEGFDTFANRGPGPVTIDCVDWPTGGDVEVDSIRVFRRQPGDRFAELYIWSGLPTMP